MSWRGVYAASKWFVTLNEGDGPINFTIGWIDGRFFVYLFAFGRRWHS